MKTIILLLAITLAITCNSQIINLKDLDGSRITNAYYKDVDNELNQFEGTYQYTNGDDELTIVLKKFENSNIADYAEDLLTGELKYKKNGVVLFDNLSKINDNLPNKYFHDICGNTLITNGARPICNDCLPNQWRARLIFFGRSNNDNGGSIVLKKYIENGVEKLKVFIQYIALPVDINDPDPLPVLIPGSQYFELTRIF